MKTIAVISNPTTEGSVVSSPLTATLNNKPIATLGSMALHYKLGTDVVKDGVAKVLLNGKPISFVGATTALGQTIMDAGATTATINGATHYGVPECPMIEGTVIEETEKEEVTLTSEYALNALYALAEDLAEATFCMLLKEIFGDDISLYAYAELYRDASEKKLENPKIVVIQNRVVRYAAFHKHKQEIHVNQKLIEKATEKKDQEAITLLYAALNEEFGHYIDWLLRNKYTQRGGDAPLDEGAAYGMLMASINLLTISKIEFATATVKQQSHTLKLELNEVQTELNRAINIYKKEIDNDGQNNSYEFFGAGLGNPEDGVYGHYGIEEVLIDQGTGLKFTPEQLNFTYLGNFMRDYSQLLTGTFMGFNKQERKQVQEGFGKEYAKEILGNMGRWLNPLKPTRETLTYVVDVLAARETMKRTNYKSIGDKMVTGILDNEAKKGIVRKLLKMGYKASQIPPKIKKFHEIYTEVTPELLGVYRPEEHIDNPIAAHVIDTLKNDYLYCPEGTKPSINEGYGCKDYIRAFNSVTGKEEQYTYVDVDEKCTFINGETDYKNRKIPTAVTYATKQLEVMHQKALKGEKNLALIHLGNALHVLEDFFAHTNFVELAVMKVSDRSFFPWVDMDCEELTNFKGTGQRFHVFKDTIRNHNHLFERYENLGEINFFDRDKLLGIVFFDAYLKLHEKQKNKKIKLFYTVSGGDELYSLKQTLDLTTERSQRQVTGIYYRDTTGVCYFLKSNKAFNDKIWHLNPKKWYNFKNDKSIIFKKYILSDTEFYNKAFRHNPNMLAMEIPYLEIPLVTGLFRGEDAIYSLLDKLQYAIEPEEFEWGDVTGKSDTLLDFEVILLVLLEDLASKQDSEDGRFPKHTGKKASEVLENFKNYIEIRQHLMAVLEKLPKFNVLEPVISLLKKFFYNLCKGILRAGIIGEMTGIKDKQTMKLGTNPTHSQIAKDSNLNPLHGLAAELAIIAVKDIGKQAHDLVFSQKGDLQTLKKRFAAYFAHPAYIDWMDITIVKWMMKERNKRPEWSSKLVDDIANEPTKGTGFSEEVDRVAHDSLGTKRVENNYDKYKLNGNKKAEEVKQSGNAESEFHKHGESGHHEHGENKIFDFENVFKHLDDKPTLFIDDMLLNEEWCKKTVEKLYQDMFKNFGELGELYLLVNKSKSAIESFAEDIENIPEKIKEIYEKGSEKIKEFMENIEKKYEDLPNNLDPEIRNFFKDIENKKIKHQSNLKKELKEHQKKIKKVHY